MEGVKKNTYKEGLLLSGEDLYRFCQEEGLCKDTSFWKEKIHQEFGQYAEFLTSKKNLELSEDSYKLIQYDYTQLLITAEEYFITVVGKNTTLNFNLLLPGPTLEGVALAVFIANLPITLRLLEIEVEDILKNPEIDLEELGSSLIFTSSEEISIDELEDEIETLSQLTLVLNNGIEEIVVTGINRLTINGFIMAFSWFRDANLHGKVYRPVDKSLNWRDYVHDAYTIDKTDLVRLKVDDLI